MRRHLQYCTTGILIGSLMGIAEPAKAINLVRFGQDCLQQEKALRLEQQYIESNRLEQIAERQQNFGNRISEFEHEQALRELTHKLEDCAVINPNSGYCHKVRMRYDEFKYRTDKEKEEAFDQDNNDAWFDTDPRHDREVLQYKIERFETLCRDSDAHYQLLNSPASYQAVCGSTRAKQTMTCTFTD